METERYIDKLLEECQKKCCQAISHLQNIANDRQRMIEKVIDDQEKEIRILMDSKSELKGKADQKLVNITFIIAIISMLITAFNIIWQMLNK